MLALPRRTRFILFLLLSIFTLRLLFNSSFLHSFTLDSSFSSHDSESHRKSDSNGSGEERREEQQILQCPPPPLLPPSATSPEFELTLAKARAKALKKQRTLATESNQFLPNGLVELNPNAPHPILDLISHSEKLWTQKNARQSQTLQQAVAEYKRRYGRKPPRGFDKWWEYVDKNSILLPDEYDQINRDLEPFLGVDPVALNEELKNEEGKSGSYTLVSRKGKVEAVKLDMKEGEEWKPKTIVGFLREVEGDLPDFRAVFSIHDGSSLYPHHAHRKAAIEAARSGTYADFSKIDTKKYYRFSWEAVCPPTSPMGLHLSTLSPTDPYFPPPSTPPPQKSFIHSHLQALDPCTHPSHAHLSGFFFSRTEPPPLPPRLIPVFGSSKAVIHENILAVAPDQLYWNRVDDPVWGEKEDGRVVWRGSNTGTIFKQDSEKWRGSQRVRLIGLGQKVRGRTDVLLSPSSPQVRAGDLIKENVSYAELTPPLMDVAFAGRAIQCDEATCGVLEREYRYEKVRQGTGDANLYKYFIDVDGNGWSARFRRLMASNSLVLKSTVFPEWFTDRIQPWVHYVPVKVDYSDLYDILLFFRGDLGISRRRKSGRTQGDGGGGGDGLGGEGGRDGEEEDGEGEGGEGGEGGREGYDHLAEKIASEGKKWIGEYWREEDMTAYMFRLMLEYARVMSLDREAASFDL
ncbi:hypothetical protein SISSUDRAFT_1050919 [Sistotremastrum suecicum HHB10207 ss-3]|uniref:Glycosyl transferase CAP10 domain-containing protein n=1 Tax=Sistotremastrum suecicum HHB10207 ss-3 TaxID=1314776 RepID=A0A166AVQ2_9AGAM|nr:hypothetical protein SISSUDRAFT_1050919 [Sistotremastrum suecicum HHB10207 ss-3]